MSTRPRHPMAEDVRGALHAAGLEQRYAERPAYQRNDYLGWIQGAKRPETRAKRLAQMLDELRAGGTYMGMPHAPSARDSTA